MLYRKGLSVLIVATLLIVVSIVSASAAKPEKPTMADEIQIISGYDMPGYDESQDMQFNPSMFSESAVYATAGTYTIRQGQTNWYGKYISQGCPGYYADLNWGNSANSLRLRIYCADGSVLGPIYDSGDGRTDGRIFIYVYNPNGLKGGTYYHEVYGYRVSGVEDYTF